MKYLTAVLFLSLVTTSAWAQTKGSEKQESKTGETAPAASQGPTIQHAPNGIVMIRSSSAATQAARAKAAKAAEEAEKAQEQPAAAAGKGKKEAAATKPQPPKARTVRSYTYGPDGERVASPITVSERNNDSGGESTQTIVGTGGRQVPYISTKEKVVTKTANHSVVERRVQRYNPQGQPTRQALVREEEKKLPNGAIEKTTTVYEEDVNGALQPTEQTVSRETVNGGKTRTVVTTERPGVSGRFQAVEQRESIETKQGDKAGVVETVVSRPNVNGRLTEAKRERSVTQKAGDTATTQTEVFERNPATGEIALSERKIGKVVERADGSKSETIQIYGNTRLGGGAGDVNGGGEPRLQQTVQHEISVRPNGEKVETTTTQSRTIADPSQLGERQVVKKVSRPNNEGETVETNVYEEGVNGKMRPTQSTVEQIKK